MNDSELLGRFARASDEAAFAEVVRRYVDLVYSAALRQTGGDRHLAEDITQQVFITLARKVASLTQHPTIVGWLYSTVRLTALGVARRERRRSHHERASAVTLAAAGSEPEWDRVRPVIDEAMQDLDEIDRESCCCVFSASKILPRLPRVWAFPKTRRRNASSVRWTGSAGRWRAAASHRLRPRWLSYSPTRSSQHRHPWPKWLPLRPAQLPSAAEQGHFSVPRG